MPELRLRLRTSERDEQTISVHCDPFTIGRGPDCELSLPVSGVSREHAQLTRTVSGWIVEDLQSTNGTLVNGQKVAQPLLVHPGDLITVGSVSLEVLDSEAQEPAVLRNSISRSAVDLRNHWIGVNTVALEPDSPHQRLSDLVEIAKALNLAVSIEAVFNQVKEVVSRQLESVERVALLVDVEGNGELQLVNSAFTDPRRADEASLNEDWISRSICGRAFTSQQAIQTADAQADARFEDVGSLFLKGIRTAMAAPLWDKDKVVGVLYADAQLPSEDWAEKGEEELSFFSALSNLVATSVQRWLLATKLSAEERIRHQLERYHSPAVVHHLVSSPSAKDGRMDPRDYEISVVFSDLVGFTALSEELTPVETAELLNRFFEEMLQTIFAESGTLDKFIGDGIMAFFGAPESQADHADRAVAAASGMQESLVRLNEAQTFHQPLQMRVAVNSGRAVVGDVGSAQRVDYTALGSTINLAARLEPICPPGQCVISGATYQLLSNRGGWTDFGEHSFKGIQRQVQVYCK